MFGFGNFERFDLSFWELSVQYVYAMKLTDWKDAFTIIGVVLTAIGVIWAVYVYRRNSNLERVKWISNLYEKFYEKDDLKIVREILDCQCTENKKSKEEKKVSSIVENETKEFTDYLNFFELIAFLKKNKQVTIEQVDDLFGYYLNCLERHESVRIYLENIDKGYELLSEMLKELKKFEKTKIK